MSPGCLRVRHAFELTHGPGFCRVFASTLRSEYAPLSARRTPRRPAIRSAFGAFFNVLRVRHGLAQPPSPAIPSYGSSVRQLACVVVLDSDDRILLGLREDFNVWGLPGGHVESGETFQDAARRETQEELGVRVELDGLIGRYRRSGGFFEAESRAFAARLIGQPPVPDRVETLDIGWFETTALPPMLWWNKLPILDAVAGRRGVERTFNVEFRFGPMTYQDVYALRDASGLSRREFYLDAFPEPDLEQLLLEQ